MTVNNSSIYGNVTELPEDSLMAFKLGCMGIISLVGIIGNLLICGALVNRCKASECFILNLAITDLMVCAIGIPLDIYDALHHTWMYGSRLCKLIYPFQTLLILVSIMTLTAMSLERYRAIITPLEAKLTRAIIVKVIIIIWILGAVVVAPYANALTYASDGQCEEQWSGKKDKEYYTLALFIIDYCIPLTIISYCYARVGFRLYKTIVEFESGHNEGLIAEIQRDAQHARLKRNTRIIKVFCFAVIMFMVCMLPGDIFWMWVSWGNGSFDQQSNHFQTFANILMYANSAINPFIFGSFNVSCMKRYFFNEYDKKRQTYSLRFSLSSSHRRRARLDAMYQWRRAAKKARITEHKQRRAIIWETCV